MATRIKEMVIRTMALIHEQSTDVARILYEKHQFFGIFESTLMIVIMSIFHLFTIFLFSISSLCTIFFIICVVSVASLYIIVFIAFHLICILLPRSLGSINNVI